MRFCTCSEQAQKYVQVLKRQKNYQALFGISLDPETKMRGGASSVAWRCLRIIFNKLFQ